MTDIRYFREMFYKKADKLTQDALIKNTAN